VAPAAPPESFPPGHFYSPIPSHEDIEEFGVRASRVEPLPGIDLNEEEQLTLLGELAKFYPSMPFTDEGSPGLRYRFENPFYSYGDAIFLYSMLRHLRPRRLIEVGSGYSSAVTLDTNDRFFEGQIECCFIEPYPDQLSSLMTDRDRLRCRVIQSRLQDVDLRLFDVLEARDVLFIDSTHVSKVNSDVNRLFFEILPRLAPGTMVHVHDVFRRFEYPLDWLRQGRSWNEQYVLRAFLQFNSSFRIRLFGNHMVARHTDWFRTHMPLCLRNPGAAFWMERTR
jgi:predicted O-methyltransferase YrrM